MGLTSFDYSPGNYDAVFCPNSGHMNTRDAKFCDQCGSSLSGIYTAGHVQDGGIFDSPTTTSSSGRRPMSSYDDEAWTPRERSAYLNSEAFQYEPDREPELSGDLNHQLSCAEEFAADADERRRSISEMVEEARTEAKYLPTTENLERASDLELAEHRLISESDRWHARVSQLLDRWQHEVVGTFSGFDRTGRTGGMQEVLAEDQSEWRERSLGLSEIDWDRGPGGWRER